MIKVLHRGIPFFIAFICMDFYTLKVEDLSLPLFIWFYGLAFFWTTFLSKASLQVIKKISSRNNK